MLIRQRAKGGKSCVLIAYPFRISSFGPARKSYSYPHYVSLFYSRLGERRNSYARRKVDVFFRDHRVVFDCFVSILQGPVPRKMVEFNPGLSQISSAVFLCNSRLHNTVEPLQRDTVMITQNVTLECTGM